MDFVIYWICHQAELSACLIRFLLRGVLCKWPLLRTVLDAELAITRAREYSSKIPRWSTFLSLSCVSSLLVGWEEVRPPNKPWSWSAAAQPRRGLEPVGYEFKIRARLGLPLSFFHADYVTGACEILAVLPETDWDQRNKRISFWSNLNTQSRVHGADERGRGRGKGGPLQSCLWNEKDRMYREDSGCGEARRRTLCTSCWTWSHRSRAGDAPHLTAPLTLNLLTNDM